MWSASTRRCKATDVSDRTQKKKLRSETILIKISKISIMICMPQLLLFGGMHSTTNSRNALVVSRRDQFHMYESEHTARYVGRHMHACMHVGIAYACMCHKYHMCQKYCITERAGGGLTYCRLSAVQILKLSLG